MAFLKKARDLITFSHERPDYIQTPDVEYPLPPVEDGPMEGTDLTIRSRNPEGPLRQVGSHREATPLGQRLRAALPDMISNGITAAATPNIAGGGWMDVVRGMAAAQNAQEQRRMNSFGLQQAAREEERKQADTASQIRNRDAITNWHVASQKAMEADRDLQRKQVELQRQTELGKAGAYEVQDQTAKQEIPGIQDMGPSVETPQEPMRPPGMIGPLPAPDPGSEPPKLTAGLPGNLPGGVPMMARATLPKEKAQPAGAFTFNDPTQPNTRLAVPWFKPEAEQGLDEETVAALGFPPGTKIPRKAVASLITAKLKEPKEPKSDPNATLDAPTRTALLSFGGDAKTPGDIAKARKLVQDDHIATSIASRPPSNAPTARADKSYKVSVDELNKIGKPIEDRSERIGRLLDTINAGTPVADSVIAPELITVMAGGAGSGVRITTAEISSVLGGRTHLESLKAALNKYQIDPSKGLSVTPPQRDQMRGLIKLVADKIHAKQALLNKAHDDLLDSEDPTEHRRIVSTARRQFSDVDQGSPSTAAPTNEQVEVWERDPAGKLVKKTVQK